MGYYSIIYNNSIKDYSIIGNFNFTLNKNLRQLSFMKEIKTDTAPNNINKTEEVMFIEDESEIIYRDNQNIKINNYKKQLTGELFEEEKTIKEIADKTMIENTNISFTSSEIENTTMLEITISSAEKQTQEITKENTTIITSIIKEKNTSKVILESDYMTDIVPSTLSLEELLSFPQEKFIKILNQLMSEKKVGNYYTIPGKNYTIIIKPCSSSNNKDKTNINFENCEKIIRKENNIPASSILTILMIEIENYNNHSLINQVEYRIFDENKKPLDISKCKDTNIIIDYSIKDSALALLDKNLISEFNNLGINIFDINDPFFNDLCVPFGYHDTDIVLEDRYNLIYKNYSFCEEGCNITKIDLEKILFLANAKLNTI